MPVSKPYLKASVKSITDLKISGFCDTDLVFSAVVLPESRYLVFFWSDKNNGQTISKIDLKSMSFVKGFSPVTSLSMLVKDTAILTVGHQENVRVYKDGQSIGDIDLRGRVRTCKSGYTIVNR